MKNILIIENGKTINNMISRMFKDKGYEVLISENYLSNNSKLPKQIPSLIIADLTTIKKEKVELLMLLKNNPVTSLVPFLLITANDGSGIMQFSSMNYYLNNPFTKVDLVSSIMKIVQYSDSISPW